MENIIGALIEEKSTGTYTIFRDGTNSDRCLVESACQNCGCELTEWYEHKCGTIVMDFQADHGFFIIIALG